MKYHRSHCSISSFVCEKGYVVKTCFLELQSHTCSLIFWARQLQDSATVNLQLIICLAVGDAINPLSSFTCSGSSKRYLHIVHKSCVCIVTIVTICLGFCMDPCCVFSSRCAQFSGQSSSRMWIMITNVSLKLPQLTSSCELVWRLKVLTKLIIKLTLFHKHISLYIRQWKCWNCC